MGPKVIKPAPWAGRHRDNVEAGIAHLCGIIAAQIEAERPVGTLMLEWFLERHQVDLLIALDPRQHRPKSDAEAIRLSIADIEELLAEARAAEKG